MGDRNARVSKHSAAAKVGTNISEGALWQLRVRSVWVARMQGFPCILRREGWERVFQEEPYGSLGSSQYGGQNARVSKHFAAGEGWDRVFLVEPFGG